MSLTALIACDSCGLEVRADARKPHLTRRKLREEHGWASGVFIYGEGTKDYCARCKPAPRTPNEQGEMT